MAATGGRQFASRGAGRTGKIAVPGDDRRQPEKILGGEQVEGRQAVRELLLAGTRRVREVWVATDLDDNEIVSDIVDIARSMRVPVQEVNRKRLEAAARSEAPQGILAYAAPLPETELTDLLKRKPNVPPFLVAVDGVTDPGNLGALLRCCEGAGVHGVVIPRHRAVHVTPTVAKAAAGAVEYMPMAVVGGLPAALARMKEAGIWIVGLDDGADRDLFELGDLASEGVCLVLGAEGAGLSRLVRERCDVIVSIPMRGRLSSLNVSAAAALATYEVARHRAR
jgi:23S rRNA (guanosine2251-2'-O)-methyltransferase